MNLLNPCSKCGARHGENCRTATPEVRAQLPRPHDERIEKPVSQIKQIEVELQETMGSDEAIANAAWTSTYDKDRREDKYDDPEKVEGIVRRCIREGHTVPVESVVLRFWLRLPVFADRQHMTHRIASHNGLSGRYRTVPKDYYRIPEDVVSIMAKAKTGDSPDFYSVLLDRQYVMYEQWLTELKGAEKSGAITNAEYKRARELLRGVIGTSYMVERTTIFNLHSFANYQRLRNSSHAQPEIQRIAQLMLRRVIDAKVAPIAIDELMKQGFTMAKPNFEFVIAED